MTYYTNEDPVYPNLELPEYVREIIETKEFQRLYKVKQLGGAHFVFEKAIHTRAEHCIGTAYLSYRLVNHLEKDLEKDKEIKPLYKKCVILAALLHDIGHGPYSHLWQDVVRQGAHKDWKHEVQSKKVVEHIFSRIRLHESNEQHDLALKLLASFITGEVNVSHEVLTPDEMFLTEIVNNEFCKIDVDKCDYLLRDSHYLKVTVKPFIDFLSRARILYDNDGISHIGYHQNDFKLIENMFNNRADFHMNIYKQYKVVAAEQMVKDICIKSSAGGVMVSSLELTEVQNDVEAFTQLDDTVLDLINKSEVRNDLIQEAQKILTDLKEGRRYSLICETRENDGEIILEELVSKFGKIFCVVEKLIKKADVPSNIPLYNSCGDDRVEMTSSLKLDYESQMIYCTSPNATIVNNVKDFYESTNNNI